MSAPVQPQTGARVFRLPDLGEGLTEAGLVQWLVAVGDTIVTDQPIAEVETAKSIVELPSPFAGVITALHGTAGDTIDVGAPVLEVADSASFPAPEAAPTSPAQPEHEAYREEERAGSGNVLIGYGTTARPTSGRRRPSAASTTRPSTPNTSTLSASAASTSAASTSEAALASGSSERHPVAVRSPLVRRLARDLGIDVHSITATGVDGAVTRADVLRAAVDGAVEGASAGHVGRVAAGTGAGTGSVETVDGLDVLARERMSPLRRAVSAKLSRSRSEIPEATVWVDVDATELWDLRARMAPEGGKAPSLTALLARFVLLALEEYPVLASRLSDSGDEIISFDGVNLGIAADTERGLLVPVVPRAHALTLSQLDTTLRELTSTARSGTMPPERLRGSTFTLNNYGGLGVDGSAAIINHPDVAILGIGRIIERPWVVDGAIVARRIVQLSLAFDHRVCDGGYAAGFLRRVTELIEHPLRAFGRV
ncbi:Dihydrolipoyllysine-residue acyltransferase component of branched-chain alpha-ketoacid dehydrogenase complex [Microbacterium oxydans]|uniref:Dihydrolipoamide acetyltransferase component of pyruvate dehydrogenase complex n=1 Tax=Microbacterium oxydans TaxID=82380 RepID=A0A0F0L1S2_9MICO|nr:dihydrolipoamide acetyltransferase family protein [Microbacterium oxydans]KJL26310.1 Dihydrolipoyllysine-residue acyltransferase component of branched-chain alpha-ketoacid dehydrogenase complex [Microbacterium oxydans]